jgi:hypothetical protein
VYANCLSAPHEELSTRFLNGFRNNRSKVLTIRVLILHDIFGDDVAHRLGVGTKYFGRRRSHRDADKNG